MSRQMIRQMKRVVAAGGHSGAPPEARKLAQEAALSLLARSIAFGHNRLAVIRLAIAVQAGADVPPDHWQYCRDAAAASNDDTLHLMFIEAAQSGHARLRAPTPVH